MIFNRYGRPAALAPRKTGDQRSGLEVELDEMQSFIGGKEAARWLWHALDHHRGRIVAYVVGSPVDDAFLELKALLFLLVSPSTIQTNGVPTGVISLRNNTPLGKHYLQKIERRHLTLRTRLKRLTRQPLCFSRSIEIMT
jgi:insertion element IS1 protein InsB